MSDKPLIAPTYNAASVGLGKLYDAAEIAKGKRYGYTPDYSFTLAALNGADLTPNGHGHFGDAGKLPSHPTFSDQAVLDSSAFHGGQWLRAPYGGEGRLGDVFIPSTDQMQQKGVSNPPMSLTPYDKGFQPPTAQEQYAYELKAYLDRERGQGIDAIEVPPPYKQIK